MKSERLSWDRYFLSMADLVSERSTCPRRSVGAVIVDPISQNVVSSGYNGSPRGTPHCGSDCEKAFHVEDYKNCRAVHGEINAIVNAAYNGVTTRNCFLYLTCTPCTVCARIIVNSGIVRVVAKELYNGIDGACSGLDELKLGKVSIEILEE